MQIEGQAHHATASLETIQVLKYLFCNFSASFCIPCGQDFRITPYIYYAYSSLFN